jgi:hypothetical protein
MLAAGCCAVRWPALHPLPLRAPHRRAPAPTLLFDLPATSTPGLAEQLAAAFRPEYELGLLSPDRVPEAAELLVDAFFLADVSADAPPQPPQHDGWINRRAPVAKTANLREERVKLTARGLEWRLGARLQSPALSLSLESSLLLALAETKTGQLAACAELSLRPRAHTRPRPPLLAPAAPTTLSPGTRLYPTCPCLALTRSDLVRTLARVPLIALLQAPRPSPSPAPFPMAPTLTLP